MMTLEVARAHIHDLQRDAEQARRAHRAHRLVRRAARRS
jgi:hypothetical protein